MKLIGAHGGKLKRWSVLSLLLGLAPITADAMPDLVVAVERARMTIEYKRRAFSPGDCAYREGCVWTSGGRKLLMLDVGIQNFGSSDLLIGEPSRRPDLFVWSGCHGHYHLKGLATYRVLTLSGRQVAKTYKQGFCLRDDRPKVLNAGPGKYTCDYQGISKGWQDVYDKTLDCQWVDISGVPPGSYNLEITVNPNRIFPETNYKNNKAIIRIRVPQYVYY